MQERPDGDTVTGSAGEVAVITPDGDVLIETVNGETFETIEVVPTATPSEN